MSCLSLGHTFRKDIILEHRPESDAHVDKQILFNLCLALLAMYTVFLVGIQNSKGQLYCKIVSGLLHYFILASFGWMFVESVRQFLRYYKRSHVLPEMFMRTGYVVSWGALSWWTYAWSVEKVAFRVWSWYHCVTNDTISQITTIICNVT